MARLYLPDFSRLFPSPTPKEKPTMSDNRLLDALSCRGLLVNVSVRYWRARKKLNPEDLGLTTDQVNARLISLGHKKLLPTDCLKSLALIESRAHALVEENTFPFLNGVARYLPNERLTEVDARLNELGDQFRHEQREFLRQYPTYREDALREWETTAQELVDDPTRLVAVIEDAFPRASAMDRHYGFQVSMFQVAVPEMPQADLVEAATQRDVIEARSKAAREARSRIEASCDEFVRESTAVLREQTAQLCRDMLATIEGTGSVHQKTLNRLVRFVDRFRQLNFMNDAEMEAQLESVRGEFLQRAAGEYRDSASARRDLVQGLESLRDRASSMAQEDVTELVNGFGKLGMRRFTLAA
jgi:hypothetical protein